MGRKSFQILAVIPEKTATQFFEVLWAPAPGFRWDGFHETDHPLPLLRSMLE